MERELTHVDLVVEVADVADDGVVLHLGHVLGHDDVLFQIIGRFGEKKKKRERKK